MQSENVLASRLYEKCFTKKEHVEDVNLFNAFTPATGIDDDPNFGLVPRQAPVDDRQQDPSEILVTLYKRAFCGTGVKYGLFSM